MIRVNNIHLSLDYDDKSVRKAVAQQLRIEEKSIKSCKIFRRSVDARKKDNIYFLTTVDAELNINEDKVCKKCGNAQIARKYEYNQMKFGNAPSPIVVGAGPAGLFAALILARSGANPILIERGRDVDRRTADVNRFWTSGQLDITSNVQFGEGGAGTFSDGKLNSGTKDIRQRKVLEEFVSHGAPDEILYNAKPHIGTDMLKGTIKNIRNEIIELGGRVMFETKLVSMAFSDNKLKSITVETENGNEIIETDNVILAIGHSARDTFEMLYDLKLPIEAKPFSVGARIEHLREKVDKAQYGRFAGNKKLGSANYKLSTHLDNGRGVYTFCMCPGGKVVNASSEENRLCTNGMSEFARDAENSNSALLVGITPDDYESDHPLAGMYLQRKLESKAFVAGGENYNTPIQRVDDFLNNRKSTHLGDVKPSIGPNYEFSNLNEILPEYVCTSMAQGIVKMGRMLHGFDDGDAVLTGVESRSSSPVRIMRKTDTLESVLIEGLYPCGEGAGYAGGIISAAVDGIKCAEKIIEKSNKSTSEINRIVKRPLKVRAKN